MSAAPPATVAELLLARADDDHVGLLAGEARWTWRQVVAASARRAALAERLRVEGPFHVAVLLPNTPEFIFWLGAGALGGAVIVGVNNTRRGDALAGDIRRTDCQLVVTDAEGAALLDGLDLGLSPDRVLRVDEAGYGQLLSEFDDVVAGDVAAAARPSPEQLFLLLFTSGTTGTPKAVKCSQGRLASIALFRTTPPYRFDRDDVAYCMMPLFHGNALMMLWAPAVLTGATVALTEKFSASGFGPDVRRYGVTVFTYVGKALGYVLSTPPHRDDAATRLRAGFGTEASLRDHEEFERRFGCVLTEGYGSSEGGIAITRVPGTPVGSLGMAADDVAIVDPETLVECATAAYDDGGRLANPDAAIGEIVNRSGALGFEGYYNDPEAEAARTRSGWYWSGDLGYRDAAGFFYFAGRGGDWLRVDSENITAGPIERILARHPAVAVAAVYAVPDPRTGDAVMAALELRAGARLDAEELAEFLATQPDLGTKWAPRFVRITAAMPQTATGRTQKAELRREGWWATDEMVWWRRPRSETQVYGVLDDAGRAELLGELDLHGRRHLIDEVSRG
jgi:fatty-acyl-CoA synthase